MKLPPEPKKIYPVQIGSSNSISVLLAGCGGTGSFTALNLARLAYAHKDTLKIRLVFIDPDQVEEKNIGRQYFCPADVGRPKAQVLAERMGAAFGLDIPYVVGRFRPEHLKLHEPAYSSAGSLQVVVGCVDTWTARRDIYQAIAERLQNRQDRRLWWIDAGNDVITGQVLAGNSLDPDPLLSEFGECLALPLPGVAEPGLISSGVQSSGFGVRSSGTRNPEPGTPNPELSCADLVALNVQARTVNYMMAAWLDVYLERLIVSRNLDIMSTTINQATGAARSQAIDHGRVVDKHFETVRIEADEDGWTTCPECGGAIIEGQDEVEEGLVVDIVFCDTCTWRMPLADFEDLLADREADAAMEVDL